MSTPCRERIVAALVAALGGIAGVTVERDRQDPVTAADLPLLAVYEGDEEAFADFAGEDAFVLAIEVEGHALPADLAALRAAVDAAFLADVTLGGLARDLAIDGEAPPRRTSHDDDTGAALFTRRYRVDYATAEGDPCRFA